MRVIVVGASGFVGRHLLAAARARRHLTVGTARAPHAKGVVAFDLLTHDIADRLPAGFLDAEEPVWAVIAAAVSKIDQALTDPAARRVNVDKTLELAARLEDLGLRVAWLSSAYVFDGSRGPWRDSDATCPITEYGRQKALVEAELAKTDALILRLDKVMGLNPKEAHPFSEWLEQVRGGRPIECIEGQVLSPSLVEDVGPAIVAACEKSLSGLYNLGNPESFSRDELARRFLAALGREHPVSLKPLAAFGFKDARSLNTSLDSSRFLAACGARWRRMEEALPAFAAAARQAGLA